MLPIPEPVPFGGRLPPTNLPEAPPLSPTPNVGPNSSFAAPMPNGSPIPAPEVLTPETPLPPTPASPPPSKEPPRPTGKLPRGLLEIRVESDPNLVSPESRKESSSVPPLPTPKEQESRLPSPLLPVGIPEYAEVKPGLANGLRPDLEGLQWLEEANFKAVLFVKKVDEDDTTDRRQAERRKFRYHALRIASTGPTGEDFTAFRAIVDDPNNRPLLVYDRSGAIAGALWYLYFRRVDQLSHEEALRRAERLGLRMDTSGEAAALRLKLQELAGAP